MTLTAGPVQTNSHQDTDGRGDTVTLTELHEAVVEGLVRMADAEQAAARAAYALQQVEGPLGDRIERNRLRSERNRRPRPPANGHNHNGHQADTRLVITNNGLITECLRCGREVK